MGSHPVAGADRHSSILRIRCTPTGLALPIVSLSTSLSLGMSTMHQYILSHQYHLTSSKLGPRNVLGNVLTRKQPSSSLGCGRGLSGADLGAGWISSLGIWVSPASRFLPLRRPAGCCVRLNRSMTTYWTVTATTAVDYADTQIIKAVVLHRSPQWL